MVVFFSDNTEVTFNSILEYDEDSSIANFTVHVLEKDTKNVYNLMILAIDYDRYHIYYGCNEKKEVGNENKNRIIWKSFQTFFVSVL